MPEVSRGGNLDQRDAAFERLEPFVRDFRTPFGQQEQVRTNFVSPEYFPVCAFRFYKGVSGTSRKSYAARASPSSIRPWHGSIGPTATQ